MTLTERAAAAAELKTTGQCNCTQSVVKVFEDKLPVEGDTLRMLAAGYAAGMGCLESTCGALIGARDGGRHPDGGPRHARCGTRTRPEL